jgi:hypothetical protein
MADVSKNHKIPLELPKSGSISLDTNQLEWSQGGRSGFHYKQLVLFQGDITGFSES